jgi:hypothetical protein
MVLTELMELLDPKEIKEIPVPMALWDRKAPLERMVLTESTVQ